MARILGFKRSCSFGFEANRRSRIVDHAGRLYALTSEPCTPRPGAWERVSRVVDSHSFGAISSFVIFLNAIFIAYASNYELTRVLRGGPRLPLGIEVAFAGWYIVEQLLRLYVYGTRLYLCRDWRWNLFDTVLVILAGLDLIGRVDHASPTFLRIMRVVKALKFLRVVRLMRNFHELRLILNSVLGSMKIICWAFALIVSVAFMFGLVFLQVTTDFLMQEGESVDPDTKEQLLAYWGSVGLSIYSLYAASLGGLDWEPQADSLHKVSPLVWLVYLMYIGFFFCVVTNTLTSLFVESALGAAEKDKEVIIQSELENKAMYVNKLKSLFMNFRGGCSESTSLEDFMERLHEPEMVYFAATLGIDIVDLKQFFAILSAGGRKEVDVESFVVGCIKLKGTAKSLDLVDLKIFIKEDIAQLQRQVRAIDRKVDHIAGTARVEHERCSKNCV